MATRIPTNGAGGKIPEDYDPISALMTGFYLVYFADEVAKGTSYFFALAILPFVTGMIIGFGLMSVRTISKGYS